MSRGPKDFVRQSDTLQEINAGRTKHIGVPRFENPCSVEPLIRTMNVGNRVYK